MTAKVVSLKNLWVLFYTFLFLIAGYYNTSAQEQSLCPSVTYCNCYNAWGETRADCSGGLTYVPGGLPDNLTELRISGSENFTHLTSGNMSEYSDLNMVELYANGLNTVHENAFGGLNELDQLLFYSNTNLKALPERIFSPLSMLRYLDLKSNSLSSEVFSTFSHVSTLEVVKLDYNPLKGNIPANAFGSNSDLETVYLSNCLITGIAQNAFENMDKMTAIYLDFNNITELQSSSFSGLNIITHVFFGYNSIQQLGIDVFSEISSTLQIIDVSNNKISSIHDDAFRNLQTLKTLYLNFNLLRDIPSVAIKQISTLDVINLSGNQITNVLANAFAGLSELNSISLCQMETLSSVDVNAFDGIANLTLLEVHSNPNLVQLTPDHLPDDEHQTLQVISITGNGFTSLQLELFLSKPSLKRVDLHSNPFHCDCKLRWMTEVYHDGFIWASHWGDEEQTSIRCQTPKHLFQFDVLFMRPGDFTCDPPQAQNQSALVITTYMHGSAEFIAHAYPGIPSTLWIGPNGEEYIPIRPIPETAASDTGNDLDSVSIRPFEELNVTEDITIVIASLRLENVDNSTAGKYKLFASNHEGNVSLTFELVVLPYEETTPKTTVETSASTGLFFSCQTLLLSAVLLNVWNLVAWK